MDEITMSFVMVNNTVNNDCMIKLTVTRGTVNSFANTLIGVKIYFLGEAEEKI